jgi:very-short-patch-repair endonuclease
MGRVSSLERIIDALLVGMEIEHIGQWHLNGFWADFYLKQHHRAIECDGDYWHSLPHVKRLHMRREGEFTAAGIQILHLTETEIMTDITGCAARIRAFLAGQGDGIL